MNAVSRNLLTVLTITLIATGCASKPPKPKMVEQWSNPKLRAQVSSGRISDQDYQDRWIEDQAACRIDAKRVVVPSASCVQPPKDDCSRLVGFARGFCESQTPEPVCDQTGVERALKDQSETLNDCLIVRGWRMQLVEGSPKETSSPTKDAANPRGQSSVSSTMSCQTDKDCDTGHSCRSKRGGGTECRPTQANL